MRLYKVIIQSKNNLIPKLGISQPKLQFGNELIFQQNIGGIKDNIHIEFESQFYLQNTSSNNLCDIANLSLYNVNKYWHNENSNDSLLNANIEIYAGTLATSLQYRQGLINHKESTCYVLREEEILLQPLYRGNISSSYSTLSGSDNILILNLRPLYENNTNISQVSIPYGKNWRQYIQSYLQQYIAQNKLKYQVVIGAPSKDSVMITSDEYHSINISGIFTTNNKNGTTLSDWINQSFNESLYLEDNIIYIGENLTTKPVIISDKDLLGQPQLVAPRTILITVPLTSKFKILQTVTLNLQTFISYNQTNITNGDPSSYGLALNYDTITKMYKGTYQITAIYNYCKSRLSGVENWCTQLYLVGVM